ncbi:DUF6177 family protein [Streptomyces sp. NA02950]|uniref:DUF6177 family protein n=1 Tax=Streptomyces sp. NA02950 TaxID=2742137 RepID=UPI0020CADFFA|nr:DUF6177 family protein [Streptomyces sp. NA02950]
MTKDVIALTKQLPDPRTIAAALLSGGPDLRLQTLGEGAVVQLTDDDGHPLVSIESPMLLAVPHEAQRLLGVRADQLGESVWWTEVRATVATDQAQRLASVVAGRLVAMLGGTLWPPEAAEEGIGVVDTHGVQAPSPPHPEQPAVDVLTDTAAVLFQDRPVLALSSWLVNALLSAAAEDRQVQIVTPPHTLLTLPARLALAEVQGRWVVREETGDYYDGLTGAVLRWQGDSFAPLTTSSRETGGAGAAAAYTPVPNPDERQLLLSIRTCHRADEHLVLGGPLEAAWRHLTGATPAAWGTAEPAGLPWSRRNLTDFARERAPRPTRLVVVGAPDRPAIAALHALRTADGVEEDITLGIGYGKDEEPPFDALAGLADDLASHHHLRSALFHVRTGRRDVNAPASFETPPIPLALALGPEETHRAGARSDKVPVPQPPRPIGARRRPGRYFCLGEVDSPANWATLHSLLGHLRSQDA